LTHSDALSHLRGQSDADQRIAFLLLDVAVETTLKTYLQLDEDVTGTKVSYAKRREAFEGNFHDVLQGIRETAGERLGGIDLSHVRYYHDLRNRLYHEGNGITVPTEKAKGYARLAVAILRSLLDVDLQSELEGPEQELAARQARATLVEKIRQEKSRLVREVNREIEALGRDLRLAAERVDPRLVSPSFEQWFTGSPDERARIVDILIDQERHWLSPDDSIITIAETWELLKDGQDDDPVRAELREYVPSIPKPLWEFATTKQWSVLDLLRVLGECSFFGVLAEIVGRSYGILNWYAAFQSEHDLGGEFLDDGWPAINRACSLDELNRLLERVRQVGAKRLDLIRVYQGELAPCARGDVEVG
jgi:hypothetical protein